MERKIFSPEIDSFTQGERTFRCLKQEGVIMPFAPIRNLAVFETDIVGANSWKEIKIPFDSRFLDLIEINCNSNHPIDIEYHSPGKDPALIRYTNVQTTRLEKIQFLNGDESNYLMLLKGSSLRIKTNETASWFQLVLEPITVIHYEQI